MASSEEFLEPSASEFEDAYEASLEEEPAAHVAETFSAELLEETVEVLDPPVPVCVSPNDIVGDVIEGMAARNHGCVLVTEDGVLTGIFTERDVIRKVVGKKDPRTTKIREVMTADPEAVTFHDTIAMVLNKMTVGGFRRVPLVDIQMRPVGIATIRDVVQYFVERFPRHVLNVPPNPLIRHPDDLSGA